MILSPQNLLPSVLASMREPRRFAQELFALNLNRETCWRLLLLVSLISVFVNHFGILLTVDLDAPATDMTSAVVLMNSRMILASPFVHATIATSIMVISVLATY